jgi:nucleolin
MHTNPPRRVPGYNVLFVGNIPWEVNKQVIEELFSSFGPKFVRMFDDPATGKHRGFAHVHFGNEEANVDKYAPTSGCVCLPVHVGC